MLPTLYALRHAEEFPAHVLPLVRTLVGGDKADYTEVDLSTGDFRVLVDPEPPQLAGLAEARKEHMPAHPVLRHFLATGRAESRLISDFMTRSEYRRSSLYGEFFRHLGVEDQLSVTVTDGFASPAAAVAIDRSRPDFDGEERRLVNLLRPHLVAARANAVRFSRALGQIPSSAACNRLARLTSRQIDVLDLLAQGRTNDQISIELAISPGTVRKHVEHLLGRLEVPTRTAAAALYLTASPRSTEPHWSNSTPRLVQLDGT